MLLPRGMRLHQHLQGSKQFAQRYLASALQNRMCTQRREWIQRLCGLSATWERSTEDYNILTLDSAGEKGDVGRFVAGDFSQVLIEERFGEASIFKLFLGEVLEAFCIEGCLEVLEG